MARILIGWELGAGSGHAIKIAAVGEALSALGHTVVFAGQQIAAMPAGSEIWQAPLWPGQLVTLARRATVTPATMGDILAVLGLASPAAVEAIIGAWGRIIDAVWPDLIVADFAPGLTLASYGRVPVVGIGSGFSLPPADPAQFPSLTGRPTVHAEPPLLDGMNRALRAHGLPERTSLPGIFRADHQHVAAFAELDPYRQWRRGLHGSPSAFLSQAVSSGGGDELFIYLTASGHYPATFWRGVVGSGLKVRLFDPGLSDVDRQALSDAGVTVERSRVPIDAIAARARIVLGHGGLGFASSALMAGLPQLIAPYDIEKQLVVAGIEAIGVGRALVDLGDQDAVAAQLRAAFADDELAACARAAAPEFRTRFEIDSHREIALAIDAQVRALVRCGASPA